MCLAVTTFSLLSLETGRRELLLTVSWSIDCPHCLKVEELSKNMSSGAHFVSTYDRPNKKLKWNPRKHTKTCRELLQIGFWATLSSFFISSLPRVTSPGWALLVFPPYSREGAAQDRPPSVPVGLVLSAYSCLLFWGVEKSRKRTWKRNCWYERKFVWKSKVCNDTSAWQLRL